MEIYETFAAINLVFLTIFNFSINIDGECHFSRFVFGGELINDELIISDKNLNLKNIVDNLSNKERFMHNPLHYNLKLYFRR